MNKIKKKLNSIIDMPSEIVLNLPKITIDSNESIWIENYRGLIEYTDKFVRLNSLEYTIIIEGENLCINFMTKEEISISGMILKVIYD